MKLPYVFGFALLSAVLALPASAQTTFTAQGENVGNVFISEINWAGSALSNADEWIELTNASSQSVDISGWVLTGAATSGDALALADETVIAPNSTLLISNYASDNEKTTLNSEPHLVSSSLSLSNSDLNIMLTTASGLVVDEVTKDQVIGSTNPFTSMERVDESTWQASTTSKNLKNTDQLGTPGEHVIATSEPSEQPEEEAETTEPIPENLAALCAELANQTEPAPEEEPVEEPENETGEEIEESSETTPEPTEESEEPTEEETETENNEQPTEEESNETEPEVVEEEQEEEVEEETVTCTCTSSNGTTTTTTEPVPTTESETTESNEESTTNNAQTLRLNELVSNPTDSVEWVEIYNFGTEPINLLGWNLKDAANKKTLLPEITLAPGAFHIVENPAGNLNNASESVFLLNANNETVDQVHYGTESLAAPKKGESLARVNNEWIVTTNITKAAANQSAELTSASANESEETYASTNNGVGSSTNTSQNSSTAESQTVSGTNNSSQNQQTVVATATGNNQSSNSSSGTTSSTNKSIVEGTVTALPGIFGSQIAYINGTQLYFYYADWPTLKLGDTVKVTGEYSSNRGETRLKIAKKDDIQIISSEEIRPTFVDGSTIHAQTAGSLITMTGDVLKREGKFYLVDQHGEIELVIHANTNIKSTELAGSYMNITGVVRVFDGTRKLYPRSEEDVEHAESPITEEESKNTEPATPVLRTQSTTPWIGGGLATLALGTLGFWYAKHKKLNFIQQPA